MDNLFLLILTPTIGAIFLLFVCQHTLAKKGALILSLITLGLTIPFICQFNASGDFNYEQSYPWIAALGVNFHIGIDGISFPLLVLTNVLVPLIVLTTFKKSFKGNFYALMFFMQSGLMLVFAAMDAFTFYVGWEAALIPIYFICALWGDGDRIRVNLKFFVYTFFGSLLMLVAILYLHQQVATHDFEWHSFVSLDLDASTQRWIFWAFFIAFAIKIPIFPFHTWQPNTYTHAPAAGTMLLAGIMLKMGVYGLLRWLLPVVPEAVASYGQLVMVLCVFAVVYASIIAIQQQDAKRLIAYSSIAHVGLISAGVFTWNLTGMSGAMMQMVNHGISVVGLFFVLDIIQDRTGSRDLRDLGGIAKQAPRLAIAFLIIVMGAIGLPLTNGFIGEFLLLKGIYEYGIWYAVFGGLTLILGAVYMLRLYQKTMLGTTSERTATFADISGVELYTLIIISGLIIYLGIFPNSLLHISSESLAVLTTFLGR
ncbi:complex I subunit 4 family protein [Sphingobacterium faecium]|jgi:NADH-quinone oxidoreductase subunit M|uniref:complex I subunit 4 family protein n=1 Tax=Sphingobacterium faecium TaxID=34087 RepID=UPI0004E5EF89|nr:NADH-quinone oxidoreductase subunit M [Sphingobacterium faecium]UXD69232.1 NADH-quinone oxidoreductase subunit M [Sphingobacterium faecium]WGQ12651.1 NADH-quinone oxidoreductase subunit M [Sphingobacterium faecium]CDS93884.1 NADH-quinone oxidoreductase subunit M [Sphingobacterium sp. PM2-P1-29]